MLDGAALDSADSVHVQNGVPSRSGFSGISARTKEPAPYAAGDVVNIGESAREARSSKHDLATYAELARRAAAGELRRDGAAGPPRPASAREKTALVEILTRYLLDLPEATRDRVRESSGALPLREKELTHRALARSMPPLRLDDTRGDPVRREIYLFQRADNSAR